MVKVSLGNIGRTRLARAMLRDPFSKRQNKHLIVVIDYHPQTYIQGRFHYRRLKAEFILRLEPSF